MANRISRTQRILEMAVKNNMDCNISPLKEKNVAETAVVYQECNKNNRVFLENLNPQDIIIEHNNFFSESNFDALKNDVCSVDNLPEAAFILEKGSHFFNYPEIKNTKDTANINIETTLAGGVEIFDYPIADRNSTDLATLNNVILEYTDEGRNLMNVELDVEFPVQYINNHNAHNIENASNVTAIINENNCIRVTTPLQEKCNTWVSTEYIADERNLGDVDKHIIGINLDPHQPQGESNIETTTDDLEEVSKDAEEGLIEDLEVRRNVEEEVREDVEEQVIDGEDRSVLFTKKGDLRKRKGKIESVSAKKQKMREKLILNHQVLPPCTTCKKKCFKNFDQKRRQELNEEYWKLSWNERHLFIRGCVETVAVKRRTISISESDKPKRNTSNTFLLKDKNGSLISVCRTFFLTTLGYTKNNNTILKTSLSLGNTSISSRGDNRGKHSNRKSVDRTLLKKHVESFHPCISHYRREHAPNRKYLPTDITVTLMHKNFEDKYKNIECSYYTYRAFVKDEMNISFTKLGHEECEQCEIFKQHNKEHSETNMDMDNCATCKKWNTHVEKAKEARKQYRQDAESSEFSPTNLCVSADLQKVIMLPRIDTFKQVLFTQRIIAFNESFVAVGKNQKFLGPVAVVWHEGIAGRKKEDICSAFHKFLLNKRDALHIKLWLDNCAGQNKNWALLSFFVHIINSSEIAANKIEIYYFEPGHSFMSADSFHHQVEQSLNSYDSSSKGKYSGGKVYDFDDFKSAIEQVKVKNVEVLKMDIGDFKDWKDHSSLAKIKKYTPRPYLSEIVKLKVERGSFNIWYSYEFSMPYKELNFLTAKYLKHLNQPTSRTVCRGVTKEKKDVILKQLCPLMPETRRKFWQELPVSDKVVDLTEIVDD